jgi:hypothetical protein
MVVFRPGGERVHHLPLIHIINVGPQDRERAHVRLAVHDRISVAP